MYAEGRVGSLDDIHTHGVGGVPGLSGCGLNASGKAQCRLCSGSLHDLADAVHGVGNVFSAGIHEVLAPLIRHALHVY